MHMASRHHRLKRTNLGLKFGSSGSLVPGPAAGLKRTNLGLKFIISPGFEARQDSLKRTNLGLKL